MSCQLRDWREELAGVVVGTNTSYLLVVGSIFSAGCCTPHAGKRGTTSLKSNVSFFGKMMRSDWQRVFAILPNSLVILLLFG
jgi:hypothetical protein